MENGYEANGSVASSWNMFIVPSLNEDIQTDACWCEFPNAYAAENDFRSGQSI